MVYCTGADSSDGRSVNATTTYIGLKVSSGELTNNYTTTTWALRISGGTTLIRCKVFQGDYTLVATSDSKTVTSTYPTYADYTFTFSPFTVPDAPYYLMLNFVSSTGGDCDVGGEVMSVTGLEDYRQTNGSQTFNSPTIIAGTIRDMCAETVASDTPTFIPPPPAMVRY